MCFWALLIYLILEFSAIQKYVMLWGFIYYDDFIWKLMLARYKHECRATLPCWKQLTLMSEYHFFLDGDKKCFFT